MTATERNEKTVFLFPGIGVNLFGGEADFFRRYRDIVEPFLQAGSAAAGSDLIAGLTRDELRQEKSFGREAFAYAFSCGAFRVLRGFGWIPGLTAGHSLGLYAALFAAEAIDFETGLAILAEAHRLGRLSNPPGRCGAAIVIGLDHDEVAAAIAEMGCRSLYPANLNSPASGVYTGYREEIDGLLAWADKAGAVKTIRLDVDIPFHSPLFMREASRDLEGFVSRLSWRPPVCPVLSALDHRLLTTVEDLIATTAANLSSQVRWPQVLFKLSAMGVGEVVECGAGVSLTQHARFVNGAPRHFNLRNFRRRQTS